ncbi:MAG: MMPL family transporter [Ruminococcus sp.]|nr:MMPL family transporter [Ruminococcus sp.]
MEMLYLYAASDKSDMSETMSIETLFGYITNDMLNGPRFSALIDDEMRNSLSDAQNELEDGKKQLVSDKYSRMIINTDYAEESPETTEFIANLNNEFSEKLTGDFYLIGNSAMTYEMRQIFDRELVFITLLTAIAIFIIVALTFKSVSIPLILVPVVQCGVYATISVIGLQGGSIYYLALLIVECILMGATIDYGILFTNYYCEKRKELPIKEALSTAYSGAAHTILTSGLILILVTAIIGNFFEEPTVSAIVKTVSTGALSATILILFILPGVLAVCDRFVIKKSKN